MSTESESGNEPTDDRPTMECDVCEMDVPAGEYCGWCGSHLDDRGIGPHWLRLRAFSASPGEHLLTPNIASSLFPNLSPASRMPFLLGLALVFAALVAATLFRLPAALITVAALGLPLLFLIYLQESDAHRDIPAVILVATAALGIGLGVGWVLLTGAAAAKSYGVPLGAGIAGSRVLREGLGVPIGGMLIMLIPAVVIRFTKPPSQESLDGFAIGALGSLMFSGAATLTRLAPQFSAGMVAKSRPMEGLLVEAGIRGIAVPVTAAAVGGLAGIALWFRRQPTKQHHRSYIRIALLVIVFGIIGVYAGIGLIDVAQVDQYVQLLVHLTMAAISLLALRVGIHLALLHEAHDDVDEDEPIQCWQCGNVVPDMAFCVACGAATRASSRWSRQARRDNRPVRIEPGADPA